MNWTHNTLLEDLATHLRESSAGARVVWEDMQLGPVGSARPDAYTIPKTFTKFTPLAYEVKVSVSDYRRDVTSGKWQQYLKFAAGVIFAVPVGMIGKNDLPAGCGLMTRSENGWKTLKAPTLQRIDTLPREAWLKLIIDGLGWQDRFSAKKALQNYHVEQKIRRRHGDRVANLLNDICAAEARLETLRIKAETLDDFAVKRRESILEGARDEANCIAEEKRRLAEFLGLPSDSAFWRIQGAVRALQDQLSKDGCIAGLTKQLSQIQNIATSALQGVGKQQEAV